MPDLASIVCDLRPGWDRGLVLSILTGHRSSVTGVALVRAAVDAADDPDIVDPRAIAWGLRRTAHGSVPTCAVCGKPADVCARRPGLDDDHEFVDRSELSPAMPSGPTNGWEHHCTGLTAPGPVRLPWPTTTCRVCGVVRS